ncbi:hypothetical protein ALC62_12471, partial [Cyphomyrmex costatus]
LPYIEEITEKFKSFINYIYLESMDTLSFNEESVYPEAIPFDDVSESDFEELVKKTAMDIGIEYETNAVQF